jgi:hypothetical protein
MDFPEDAAFPNHDVNMVYDVPWIEVGVDDFVTAPCQGLRNAMEIDLSAATSSMQVQPSRQFLFIQSPQGSEMLMQSAAIEDCRRAHCYSPSLAQTNAWPQSISPATRKLYATREDWDIHRAEITRLYLDENRDWKEVKDAMERKYAFFAT